VVQIAAVNTRYEGAASLQFVQAVQEVCVWPKLHTYTWFYFRLVLHIPEATVCCWLVSGLALTRFTVGDLATSYRSGMGMTGDSFGRTLYSMTKIKTATTMIPIQLFL